MGLVKSQWMEEQYEAWADQSSGQQCSRCSDYLTNEMVENNQALCGYCQNLADKLEEA